MEALKPIGLVPNLRVAHPHPRPSTSLPIIPKPTKPSIPICRSSRWADRLLGDFHFLPTIATETPPPPPSATSPALLSILPPLPSAAAADRTLPLPIDYYQILGAETHFLSDGIRRAYEARVSRPPQYGFSPEALVARRQILQAACDTLSNPTFRADYNRGLLDDPDSTLAIPIPWDKVPGALCVLQESGEAELVLRAGHALLLERLPKPIKQDVVLAMVLAYVDLSRDAMALSPPDCVGCCEVLERALRLLQEEGASNLALDLHSQIDETLEEITPRCVLELLGLPLDEEYRIKREEGLIRVRSILWSVGGGGAAAIGGGFTREHFMNEALSCMTATEQVELFAATPTNIPRESFEVYGVTLALVARAFVDKKPQLIKDADNLFLQLQQSRITPLGVVSDFTKRTDHEIDFALERGLCSLLLGDVDKCLSWLGIDTEGSPFRDPSIVEFVMDNSNLDDDTDLLPGLCKLLETWLLEVVFIRFRDTQNISFRLGDYYDDSTVLRYLERMDGGGRSPLAAAAAIVKIGAQATVAIGNVRSSALQALRKVFPLGKAESVNTDKCNDGHDLALEMHPEDTLVQSITQAETSGNSNKEDSNEQDFTQKIKVVSVMIICGGAMVGVLAFVGLRYLHGRSGLPASRKEIDTAMAANVVNLDTVLEESLLQDIPKMDVKFAETLVRNWQNIKSQALGPDHCLTELSQVLDGQMLKGWADRAAEIEKHSWFWVFTLLDLTVDSVTVSSDGRRAMVEATIKEEAKLMDTSNPNLNESSCETYTTRYEMAYSKSGWKITEGAVLQ